MSFQQISEKKTLPTHRENCGSGDGKQIFFKDGLIF